MTGDSRDERVWAGLVARLEGVEAHVTEPPPWRGAEPTSARPDGVALGPTLVGRPPKTSSRALSRRPLALGSAALVLALLAVALVARPTARDQFGASPSTPPTSPPAPAWGPLAVIPPQDGADEARNEGTLRITDICVTLERGGEVELLFWPADRTTWDAESQTITFENFDGSTVTVADGDDVVLGGGGDSEAEGGLSGEEWVAGMEWVAPPNPSCPLDPRFGVGAVDLAGGSAPLASPVATSAEVAGLKLVAAFDRMEVEAGGTVTVALSLENTRSTDVVFDEPCAFGAMTVEVRAPVEPIGRDWDGIAAAFKTYALKTSTGTPIESSIREPLRTVAKAQPCHATKVAISGTGVPTTIIEAGTTYETVLTWTAEIVRGVPSLPGPAPFSIKVLYDLEPAGGLIRASTLEATGIITVLAGAPSAISAGQALDAALGDPEFAAWLERRPDPLDAWENANLFLQGPASAANLPDVPHWVVELFREPRNWAILYIDAMTGEVLRRNFCDIPCDR